MTGLEIDNTATTAGCCQVKIKPTHFLNGDSSSIDLSFSSNMSFIRNYGIESSNFQECHHNVTYSAPDFNVLLAPPYYRETWDYENTDTDSIQKCYCL